MISLSKELSVSDSAGMVNPLREIQLFIMIHLGVDELFLMKESATNIDEIQNFDKILIESWVQRRKKDEPFEYITNKVSFYSQTFFIEEGALIPRPETELLIDEVIKILDKECKILFVEVGVGSGIISILLAQHFKNARFIAIDISKDALKIAKINIDAFGLTDRIELREGSLLEPINEAIDGNIDFLVSNPPYIAKEVFLENNLSYEPQNALFGGNVGDELIQKLLDSIMIKKIPYFVCEMGYDQKDKVTNYMKQYIFTSLEFYQDYSQFDRGFRLIL
jgi:release factor glutamine methyltransferase